MTDDAMDLRISELETRTRELQEAAIDIRWDRIAPSIAEEHEKLLKTGRAFNPRTPEDLHALYRGYKELYKQALNNLTMLKDHREELRRVVRTQKLTRAQLERMDIETNRVDQDIREAEEGIRYLRGRVDKWKVYVDRATTRPVDVQGVFTDTAHDVLGHIEHLLLSPIGAIVRAPLTKKRLQEMIQEAEKVRDIANYEAKQLSRAKRQKEDNRKSNERFWRQAQRSGLNTQGYVNNDRMLAAEIRDLREQIQKQRRRAARAERLIRDLKYRLRRGPFSAASLQQQQEEEEFDDMDSDLELEPVGVSVIPKRLKRLRKKRQARSHEKQAKREARKARKARQQEIRLQEKPLEEEEKKLSRELKQAKKREKDIKRKERALIKRRRDIRNKRRRLKKERRRAGRKKVVASSLDQADPALPGLVVSNMVEAADAFQRETLEEHHESLIDDALHDAGHALMSLANAALAGSSQMAGDHWLKEYDDDDDDDDDYLYAYYGPDNDNNDDEDEYGDYEQVSPGLSRWLSDWLGSWGEAFRSSSSALGTLGMHVPPDLSRKTFHYAGERVSDLLARHPMALQADLVGTWHRVHTAFEHLLKKVGDRQRAHQQSKHVISAAGVAKQRRQAAADTQEARVQCTEALKVWTQSLADATAAWDHHQQQHKKQ